MQYVPPSSWRCNAFARFAGSRLPRSPSSVLRADLDVHAASSNKTATQAKMTAIRNVVPKCRICISLSPEYALPIFPIDLGYSLKILADQPKLPVSVFRDLEIGR